MRVVAIRQARTKLFGVTLFFLAACNGITYTATSLDGGAEDASNGTDASDSGDSAGDGGRASDGAGADGLAPRDADGNGNAGDAFADAPLNAPQPVFACADGGCCADASTCTFNGNAPTPLTCTHHSTCNVKASGLSNVIVCQNESTCDVDCSGGYCTLICEGEASCDFACVGGHCLFDCATTGSCTTFCDGGTCDTCGPESRECACRNDADCPVYSPTCDSHGVCVH